MNNENDLCLPDDDPIPPPPFLIRWGRSLILFFFLPQALIPLLLAALDRFYPPAAQHIRDLLVEILIGLWIPTATGLIMTFIGWIFEPTCMPYLQLSHQRRPDGRVLSRWLKYLLAATCLLLAFIVAVLYFEYEGTDQVALAFTPIMYAFFIAALFGFYLCVFFDPYQDIATNTYLQAFYGIFAFVMLPVAWPFLLFHHVRIRRLLNSDAFPRWTGQAALGGSGAAGDP